MPICKEDDCTREVFKKDWCRLHYKPLMMAAWSMTTGESCHYWVEKPLTPKERKRLEQAG